MPFGEKRLVCMAIHFFSKHAGKNVVRCKNVVVTRKRDLQHVNLIRKNVHLGPKNRKVMLQCNECQNEK